MNAKELYEEWTEGEKNGMRPKRVQALRDDFEEVTGMTVPRTIAGLEGWLDVMNSAGVITRKLKEAAEGSDEPNADEDPPPEEGD